MDILDEVALELRYSELQYADAGIVGTANCAWEPRRPCNRLRGFSARAAPLAACLIWLLIPWF